MQMHLGWPVDELFYFVCLFFLPVRGGGLFYITEAVALLSSLCVCVVVVGGGAVFFFRDTMKQMSKFKGNRRAKTNFWKVEI